MFFTVPAAANTESAYFLVIDRKDHQIVEQIGTSFAPVHSSFGTISCSGNSFSIDDVQQFTFEADASFCLLLYDETTQRVERTICVK